MLMHFKLQAGVLMCKLIGISIHGDINVPYKIVVEVLS